MKKHYLLTIALLTCWQMQVRAQQPNSSGFGPQQVITTQTGAPQDVYAADLDGDGDQDVLSASTNGGKIAWYENDGEGNFEEQQVITTRKRDASSVYAADLDGDGDQDVLSAFAFENKIAWYENDGQGNFSEEQIISTQAISAQDVYAADLDNDGDQDVLSASNSNAKIAWYENDGQGNFGSEQVISIQTDTQTDFGGAVYAADLDGDGDQDVLSTFGFLDSVIITDNSSQSFIGNGEIAWYENDGQGNFSEQQIISTQVFSPQDVYAADLDGDGDQDVLSASFSDAKLAWYENDGQGNFSEQQVIDNISAATSVYAADIDGDGDADVISGSADGITWYENDGQSNFSGQQVISTEVLAPVFVYAADLDGDGNLDVLSGSFNDSKIAWYENLLDEQTATITGFALINNDTDQALRSLQDGDVVSLGDLNSTTFTVRADVTSAGAGIRRVAFNLASPFGRVIRSEYAAPYSLFSDDNGDYFGRKAFAGVYTLTATPYSFNGTGQEVEGESKTIRFTFVDGTTPAISSFTLVNNNTDKDLQLLEDGDRISLDDLPTFTVRANVAPGQQRIRRVAFRLDAPVGQQGVHRSEYAVPYALFSDNNGDYFGRKAIAGEYTLTAIPYYLDAANREVEGTSSTIRFTFVGDQAASSLLAYPVPFNETLTLTLGTVDMNQTQIQLVHGYGQAYEVQASQVSQTERGLVLNLAGLPSGPYTVRIISKGQMQTLSVSKQ